MIALGCSIGWVEALAKRGTGLWVCLALGVIGKVRRDVQIFTHRYGEFTFEYGFSI